MDGGYADEDINLYTEEKYLELRWENEIQKLEPYNMFYVMRDGIKCQLIEKDADGKDIPINYSSWMPDNRELDPFTMEYGVRVSNAADENDNYNLLYQLPYGVSFTAEGKLSNTGSLYESGEGYYKYRRNPRHEMMFEYNDSEEYFTDDSN